MKAGNELKEFLWTLKMFAVEVVATRCCSPSPVPRNCKNASSLAFPLKFNCFFFFSSRSTLEKSIFPSLSSSQVLSPAKGKKTNRKLLRHLHLFTERCFNDSSRENLFFYVQITTPKTIVKRFRCQSFLWKLHRGNQLSALIRSVVFALPRLLDLFGKVIEGWLQDR